LVIGAAQAEPPVQFMQGGGSCVRACVRALIGDWCSTSRASSAAHGMGAAHACVRALIGVWCSTGRAFSAAHVMGAAHACVRACFD